MHSSDRHNEEVEVPLQPQVEDIDGSDDSDQSTHLAIGKSESMVEQKLLQRHSSPNSNMDSKQGVSTLTNAKVLDPSTSSSSSKGEGKKVNLSEIPFPNSYVLSKKVSNEKKFLDMMDIFSKIEVNLPLLDVLKGMPACAKFLKDLCTQKRRCKPNECVQLSPSVSAMFKPHLPIKCKDPGSFTVPCTIGTMPFSNALLDLGAAINVMPYSVYTSLGLTNIKSTSVILQLADRTTRKPHGLLEDILVKVKDLVFPADFYVLDMSIEVSVEEPLILGRPFMRTANTIISMKDGYITMEVGDHVIRFNVYEAMNHPFEDYSLLGLNEIDLALEEAIDESTFSLCVQNDCHDDVYATIGSNSSPSIDCDDDMCSIDCMSIDSSLSTSNPFIFDFSNLGSTISSFDSYHGVGKELLCSFAEFENVSEVDSTFGSEATSISTESAPMDTSGVLVEDEERNQCATDGTITIHGSQLHTPPSYKFQTSPNLKDDCVSNLTSFQLLKYLHSPFGDELSRSKS